MTRTKLARVASLVALARGSGGLPARAQERVKIRVAALTLPVFNPIIVNQMGAKERKSIRDRFERAVAATYLGKLPDDAMIYTP